MNFRTSFFVAPLVKSCLSFLNRFFPLMRWLVYPGIPLAGTSNSTTIISRTLSKTGSNSRSLTLTSSAHLPVWHRFFIAREGATRDFGWDRRGGDLIPNWQEQDVIDYMRHRHYVQGWSGNKISKQLNEFKVKGKRGGSWTSSMILRTCRYQFHEIRNSFEAPKWWGSAEYHDSVSW